MTVKPLSDYVLVEPKKEQEQTLPSGIVLPDSAKEKPYQGIVLAVGPGKRNEDGEYMKMGVKEGDVVYYKKWGGTEIKSDNKEYMLIKEEDLLAIIEE